MRLAGRRVDPPYREDGGELRVVTRGPTFGSLAALAFDQVRQNAGGNVAVLGRLLRAIETVAGVTRSADRRQVLRSHAEAVLEVAGRTVPAAGDRGPLEAAARRLVALLDRATPPATGGPPEQGRLPAG